MCPPGRRAYAPGGCPAQIPLRARASRPIKGSPPAHGGTDGDCRNQRSDHRGHPAARAAGCRDASLVDARGPAHLGGRPRPADRVGSRALDAGHPPVEHRVLRALGQGLERLASGHRARSRDRAGDRDHRRVRPVLGEGSLGSRRVLGALGHAPRPRRPRSRAASAFSPTTRSAPACSTTSAPRSCSAVRRVATTR